MVLSSLLSFLKSPKFILSIGGLLLVGGIGYYGVNLIQENVMLEDRLSSLQSTIDRQTQMIEEERKEFESTISNYDKLMSQYFESMEQSEERSRSLQQTISNLSRESHELQQCLQTDVPNEIMNQLNWRSE